MSFSLLFYIRLLLVAWNLQKTHINIHQVLALAYQQTLSGIQNRTFGFSRLCLSLPPQLSFNTTLLPRKSWFHPTCLCTMLQMLRGQLSFTIQSIYKQAALLKCLFLSKPHFSCVRASFSSSAGHIHLSKSTPLSLPFPLFLQSVPISSACLVFDGACPPRQLSRRPRLSRKRTFNSSILAAGRNNRPRGGKVPAGHLEPRRLSGQERQVA